MVRKLTDEESRCLARNFHFARMEFLLQVERGRHQLVVFGLMPCHGGLAIFGEIGFLGGEMLRHTGDEGV